MIVWGGAERHRANLNTGGRYNPEYGRWTSTSTTNAPDARVLAHGGLDRQSK